MNVSKKKHITWWWTLGLGLVIIPAWLLFFYLASLAIYDILVDTLVVALTLGIVSALLSRVVHLPTSQEALVVGGAWAFLLLLVELLITLPNGTTGIIFGTWATYVVYMAIALAPWLVFLATHHRIHRQEPVL